MSTIATPRRASARGDECGGQNSKRCAVLRTDVDDRERAIEAITQKARAERPRHSTTFWVAALVVGMIGLGAFFKIMRTDGERPTSTTPPPHESGLATGIVIGIAVGIAIGYAIGRGRKD